jgi:hypothetical protein
MIIVDRPEELPDIISLEWEKKNEATGPHTDGVL